MPRREVVTGKPETKDDAGGKSPPAPQDAPPPSHPDILALARLIGRQLADETADRLQSR